jgi:ribosomal protein S18 acetylase RimI-like enzyme
MKAGSFIRRFAARDGRDVILRAPRWSDLDDMLEFINTLVDEGAEIMATERKTREEEIDWLSRHLSNLEKGKKVAIAAEVDGRFIGQVEVNRRSGYSSHVGVLGIAIRDGYRDVGIGTELMREAEAQATKMGLEVMTLEVFASNDRALHMYEKVGYRSVGCVPKAILKEGKYIDNVIMAKEIAQ